MHAIRSKLRLLLALPLAFPLLLAGPAVPAAEAAGTATVTVDASSNLGAFHNPADNINQADYAYNLGPLDLERTKELAFQYSRAWIKPDFYYDPATGLYDYDYPMPEVEEGVARNETLYDFMDQVASYTDRIMLNVDQCVPEMMDVTDTTACRTVLKNGIKHYKERYPEIEYIEVFNEADKAGWTPGPEERGALSPEDYYVWYKEFYHIVKEVNEELDPAIPLKVGGPASFRIEPSNDWLPLFMALYAADTDPDKRMDFFSYHNYRSKSAPAGAENHKSLIRDTLLTPYGAGSAKIFVTEYGLFPGPATGTVGHGPNETDDILTQAAGLAAIGYYYIKSGIDMTMHWALDHPSNVRKDMYVDGQDGVPTPYYNMIKMQRLLKTNRTGTTSTALNADGIGVHALATRDASGMAIMAVNYQWISTALTQTDYNVTMNINDLPSEFAGKSIKVERYLIDDAHSNYKNGLANAELQKVEEYVLSPRTSVSQSFYLDINGMSLIMLTPVHQLEAEDGTATVSAGDSELDVADAGSDNGAFNKFVGNAAGDYVQYALSVPKAGTYAVYVKARKGPDRAKYQVSIGGTLLGGVKDTYSSAYGYDRTYIGTRSFGAGSANFRFALAGTTGGSYVLGIDSIQLVPVSAVQYELENYTPWSASGDRFEYVSTSSASGGAYVKADTNAASDDLQFMLPVKEPGTYTIKVGVRKLDTRGTFQFSLDGVNMGGQQDGYAPSLTYDELTLGQATFDKAGYKRFKFYVNGKNASSGGYDLAFDYIKLVP